MDAASTDGTVGLVQQTASSLRRAPRVIVAPHRIPIGEARNIGLALAEAPLVAFLSADAELDPRWIHEALGSLREADMAFGRQIHQPRHWTLGAGVRGLRYAFPTGPTRDPLRYASNVASAYHKSLLARFSFDPWANAAEDLLLARRAAAAGFRGVYNPRMVVFHHDVTDARAELRKNLREGYGLGLYVRELGVQSLTVAWGATLVFSLALFLLPLHAVGVQPLPAALLFGCLLWLPALRRGLRRHPQIPFQQRVRAIAATPLFDVAFLVTYAWGLARSLRNPLALKEVPP